MDCGVVVVGTAPVSLIPATRRLAAGLSMVQSSSPSLYVCKSFLCRIELLLIRVIIFLFFEAQSKTPFAFLLKFLS